MTKVTEFDLEQMIYDLRDFESRITVCCLRSKTITFLRWLGILLIGILIVLDGILISQGYNIKDMSFSLVVIIVMPLILVAQTLIDKKANRNSTQFFVGKINDDLKKYKKEPLKFKEVLEKLVERVENNGKYVKAENEIVSLEDVKNSVYVLDIYEKINECNIEEIRIKDNKVKLSVRDNTVLKQVTIPKAEIQKSNEEQIVFTNNKIIVKTKKPTP